MTHDEQIDAFIRDVTQAGSLPKGEVRRRLKEMEAEQTKKIIEVLNWKMRPHDECERCGDGYDCGCGYYWRTKTLDEAIERIKGLDN